MRSAHEFFLSFNYSSVSSSFRMGMRSTASSRILPFASIFTGVQVGSTSSAGESGSGYGQETEITSNGARFDGDGDYLSIPSIDYATDST